jgi:hypothetical protein
MLLFVAKYTQFLLKMIGNEIDVAIDKFLAEA